MSHLAIAPGRHDKLQERLAWAGLACAAVAMACSASLDRPRMYAAIGPDDVKVWAAAIAAAAGSMVTVVNLVMGCYLRWFAPHRRRRRKDRDAPPDDPPQPTP